MPLETLRLRTQVLPGHVAILVTEVTRMSGTTICVAGIRLDDGRCVRPLQWNGNNWTESKAPSLFQVGALIDGTIRPAQEPGALPHRRENLRLSADPTRVGTATPRETYDTALALAQTTVQAGLGVVPVNDAYVIEGTDCSSLFGLRVRASNVAIHRVPRNNGRIQTRCTVSAEFDFPVTSLDLSDVAQVAHLSQNITALGNVEIVLRCGLARRMDKFTPARCYIQVNGFILPPAS